jgi:hypothetical protein
MRQVFTAFQRISLASALALGLASGASSQTQFPPAVQKHLDAATVNAGGDQDLINYIRKSSCFEVDDPGWRTWARTQMDQEVPLLQIFDDLWFVGNKYVGMYFLKTADRGVMMIDTMNNTADADKYAIPSLQKLGLPLRGIYITHGHGDHDGGVNRLRQVYGYGWPVFIGSGDAPSKQYQPTPVDSTNEGVQPVSIGGTTIFVQAAPGHTPGNQISLIPVHHKGVRHMLVMNWRSAVPGSASLSKQYVTGVERVYWMARAGGAEGFIHTHAISDATVATINQIMASGSRDTIPLFFGAERTARATAVARECSVARAQQIDPMATFSTWRVNTLTFLDTGPDLKKVAARLQNGWGPLVGQEVTFSVASSGAACTSITGADGVAECKTRMTVRSGEIVKASYAGATGTEFVDLPAERTKKALSPACTAGASGTTPPGNGLVCE